jgi:hypothetical protein
MQECLFKKGRLMPVLETEKTTTLKALPDGAISSFIIATGNGLHVELDENGSISLVLWGIEIDDDTTIFETKLTAAQEQLIRNSDKIDAWKIDPTAPCPQCTIAQ